MTTRPWDFVDASSVPGWSTTEGDNQIEVWTSSFNTDFSAVDGSQFAELNANQASTLYQTVDTSAFEGKTVRWGLSHRGRGSATVADVMHVLIGSDLATMSAQVPTGAMTTDISDTNVAWGRYSGTYTIPAGQASTVFAFQAVSTGSGSISVGNFLDDISLGTHACLIDTKTVTNLSRVSGPAQVGDTLQYTVSSLNDGGAPAEHVVTSDALPAGLTFVPGSLSVTNASITKSSTDASGDDDAEYNPASRSVTARLGVGASPTEGGSIPAGATSSITFQTVVNSSGPVPILNTASTNYFDSLGSNFLTSTSDTTTNPVQNEVIAADDSASTSAGSAVTTSILANDSVLSGGPGLDPTSVAVSTAAAHGTVVLNASGTITYTPTAGFSGRDTYKYTVCDSGSPDPVCSSPATVTVSVANVFTPGPAASDYPPSGGGVNTPQNVATTINLDSIVTTSGLPPTSAVPTPSTGPTHGAVTIDPDGAGGFTVLYTPDTDYSGADTFSVTACDTNSQCATIPVTVEVGVNQLELTNDTANVNGYIDPSQANQVIIPVLSNDHSSLVTTTPTGLVPGAPLAPSSLTIASAPAHGTATANSDGTVTYAPDAYYASTDSFTYSVCDTSNPTPICADATVAVAVSFSGPVLSGPTSTGLAFTGTDAEATVKIGLTLVLAGLVLTFVSAYARRRRVPRKG